MRYFDIRRRWRRIKPHLDDPELRRVLERDMRLFRPTFRPGQLPRDADSCDWRFFDGEGAPRRGRPPAFWDYAVHSGCHWVVNFNLRLAELVEPKRPWRIVTTQKHSTVWDGAETLFDINFLALGVHPDEAWSLARTGGRILKIGKERRCYDAQPGRGAAKWRAELARKAELARAEGRPWPSSFSGEVSADERPHDWPSD